MPQKPVTAVIFSDVDFILNASNFDNFAAFRANFSYIFCACAEMTISELQ